MKPCSCGQRTRNISFSAPQATGSKGQSTAKRSIAMCPVTTRCRKKATRQLFRDIQCFVGLALRLAGLFSTHVDRFHRLRPKSYLFNFDASPPTPVNSDLFVQHEPPLLEGPTRYVLILFALFEFLKPGKTWSPRLSTLRHGRVVFQQWP